MNLYMDRVSLLISAEIVYALAGVVASDVSVERLSLSNNAVFA